MILPTGTRFIGKDTEEGMEWEQVEDEVVCIKSTNSIYPVGYRSPTSATAKVDKTKWTILYPKEDLFDALYQRMI